MDFLMEERFVCVRRRFKKRVGRFVGISSIEFRGE